MKVILLQDIARVGRKYEIKEVPDGHAQNFLIPRKMAEPATPQNLKRVQERTAHIETERAAAEEAFDSLVETLRNSPVTITAKVNEQGHLFKGLRAADIAAAFAEQTGTPIESNQVLLDAPIKETGEHQVALASGTKHEQVTVMVVAS